MAKEIPTQVPENFNAGDSFDLKICSNEYTPGDGWAMELALRGPSQATVTSNASGNDHVFSILPAVTKTWAPGEYFWQIRAKNGTTGAAYTVSKGRLKVLVDYASVTDQNFSDKSPAEKALCALLAAQAGTATQDQLEYRIDGIVVRRMEPGMRIALIEKYQRMVAREQQANAHLNPANKKRNRVYTRFV